MIILSRARKVNITAHVKAMQIFSFKGLGELRRPNQLVVQKHPLPVTYFVHVVTSDGRRSNWKKLIVP